MNTRMCSVCRKVYPGHFKRCVWDWCHREFQSRLLRRQHALLILRDSNAMQQHVDSMWRGSGPREDIERYWAEMAQAHARFPAEMLLEHKCTPTPSPMDNPQFVLELPAIVSAFLDIGDTLGATRHIQEGLIMRGYSLTSKQLLAILSQIQDVAVQAFHLPVWVTYHSEYMNAHIEFYHRETTEGLFAYLMLLTYALGARRENLPPPQDELVWYYQHFATPEGTAILCAKNDYLSRPKKPARPKTNPPPDLTQKIRAWKAMDFSDEQIAEEIRKVMTAWAASNASPTPLNQNDLIKP